MFMERFLERIKVVCFLKDYIVSLVIVKIGYCVCEIENKNKYILKIYYGLFILDFYFVLKYLVEINLIFYL